MQSEGSGASRGRASKYSHPLINLEATGDDDNVARTSGPGLLELMAVLAGQRRADRFQGAWEMAHHPIFELIRSCSLLVLLSGVACSGARSDGAVRSQPVLLGASDATAREMIEPPMRKLAIDVVRDGDEVVFHFRYCDTGLPAEVSSIGVEMEDEVTRVRRLVCASIRPGESSWRYGEDPSGRCDELPFGVLWVLGEGLARGGVGITVRDDGEIEVFKRTCTLPGMTPLSPRPPEPGALPAAASASAGASTASSVRRGGLGDGAGNKRLRGGHV